jgi:hypothetical protein
VKDEDFEKAFIEWINSYPDLPMEKKVLFDFMNKRKEEAVVHKANVPVKK